ncbi:transposable element tc3 transposase, putative [Trichosporon asahii var. asahii CBS 2479]|uniref:Transposable element tc3 transposase, putative n=1 Tax=Trichosporon asahii var. asahii (strain ATCC 90039 / CBS 2479 / JCM 2466 / KCTC 7840 / NBRC 103889/ NCYC 2677 / UAMH 7654) TaxID=1186058 RepID=J5SFU5_TRIAS|nr:transposable element tc3 transposase, putative [Trichosporon asahii var. asahii CBS 2479]EJT45436.1 transposable element tc3 transposase, putative [Trichosporon asahii var. asahii CBS 2479]
MPIPVTPTKRGRIIGYWERCKSVRETHRHFEMSFSTVRNLVAKFRSVGHIRTEYKGRRSSLSPEKKAEVLQRVESNPFLSINELADDFEIHRTTMSNQLREAGYYSCIVRRTPYLTDEHINRRIVWAIQYRGFCWDRVIYCDESTFSNKNYQPVRCIRPLGLGNKKRYTKAALCGSRYSVNVYGAMAKGHKFPLVNVKAEVRASEAHPEDLHLTGERYV